MNRLLSSDAQRGRAAVLLPAVAGNYISTPHATANARTGAWDVRFNLGILAVPGATQCLFAKRTATGNNKQINLGLNADGTLGMTWSANGSTDGGTLTSDAALTFPFWKYLRLTFDPSSAGSARANFYTSRNGNKWDSLGTERTTAATTIFNGAAILELGSFNVGANQALGAYVMSADFMDGINGALAQRFDASRHISGMTVRSITGEVWTINRSGSNPSRIAA